MLSKLRNRFVEAIFLSSLSLGIVNTIMISFVTITGNLDRIQKVIPLSQSQIILVFWPIGLVGMLVFSYVMDRVVGYARTYSSIANSRNPQITELVDTVRRIESKLDELEAKVK